MRRGVDLTIVPWNHDLNMEKFDGLFISNGPGDPQMCLSTISAVRKLLECCPTKPIMGICMGNQLLAAAAGASTYKLRYEILTNVVLEAHSPFVTTKSLRSLRPNQSAGLML